MNFAIVVRDFRRLTIGLLLGLVVAGCDAETRDIEQTSVIEGALSTADEAALREADQRNAAVVSDFEAQLAKSPQLEAAFATLKHEFPPGVDLAAASEVPGRPEQCTQDAPRPAVEVKPGVAVPTSFDSKVSLRDRLNARAKTAEFAKATAENAPPLQPGDPRAVWAKSSEFQPYDRALLGK